MKKVVSTTLLLMWLISACSGAVALPTVSNVVCGNTNYQTSLPVYAANCAEDGSAVFTTTSDASHFLKVEVETNPAIMPVQSGTRVGFTTTASALTSDGVSWANFLCKRGDEPVSTSDTGLVVFDGGASYFAPYSLEYRATGQEIITCWQEGNLGLIITASTNITVQP